MNKWIIVTAGNLYKPFIQIHVLQEARALQVGVFIPFHSSDPGFEPGGGKNDPDYLVKRMKDVIL
jgi:hypothetical protein